MLRADGWWGLGCWNGLSDTQQSQLIKLGHLEIGYIPAGECQNPATCFIETVYDKAPGPRFYCIECGEKYLAERKVHETTAHE